MKRQPMETETYKEEWLFGDEARAWLASHKPDFYRDFAYDKMLRRYFRAEMRINDGWGIIVSYDKRRPTDQSCRRCVCPRCGHELQLNQGMWAHRHERKCNLPTQATVGGALGDAFNVFSTPPGTDRMDVYVAGWLCRAFKKLKEAT